MGLMRFIAAGAVACGLALPAAAVEVQQLESPNGLPFWLVEEHSIPMVALEIAFEGGARLDPAEKLGVSPMVAGLMDEGAGDLDAIAWTKAKDDLSARFGFAARQDTFNVSALMLTEYLDPSVELLATTLAAPRFDDEPIGRVRAQILSRLAQAATEPDEIVLKAWWKKAFPDHPYGRPTMGTPETVTALEKPDLKAAHQRLLTRSNAVIGIVGDIDPERAGTMVDTVFAGLPEGEKVTTEAVEVTAPPGLDLVQIEKPQSVAYFGHAGIPREDPDFMAAYVMNYILGGGGFESRLMTEVREKRGLAYSVYSYLQPLDEAALYVGKVSTANERMAESLDVIRSEWKRMADGDVTEEELARAKKYLTGAFPLRFDSNGKIADYLVFLQRTNLGADYIDTRNDQIEAVTLDDIKRVAARLLKPEDLSITVVGAPAGL